VIHVASICEKKLRTGWGKTERGEGAKIAVIWVKVAQGGDTSQKRKRGGKKWGKGARQKKMTEYLE